jgi:RimJ/RimL family protein N-acetyltransferase
MYPNLQPILSNSVITLMPLQKIHFQELYTVAADPKIWEQHPNWDRYKLEVFTEYFNGALQSKGAFIIRLHTSKEIIGCTRFYEYNAVNNSIAVGFTFLATKFWGGVYNKQVKTLMFNHAFTFVNTIILHIGATNVRSQKGNEKIGAVLIDKVNVGLQEKKQQQFIYAVHKKDWLKIFDKPIE